MFGMLVNLHMVSIFGLVHSLLTTCTGTTRSSVLLCCAMPYLLHVVLQEVQRRKAAQQESERLKAELQKLRPQLTASDTKVSELQSANAELRVALNELKQQLQAGTAPSAADSAVAVAQLQQQLAAKDAEVAGLRRVLGGLEQQLAAATAAGGISADSAQAVCWLLGGAVQGKDGMPHASHARACYPNAIVKQHGCKNM